MASKRRPIEPEPEPVFESLDLIAAVEKRLTKRQSLQDEIAAIDDELRRVYERIGQDRPAPVVAPPSAPAVAARAALAPSPSVVAPAARPQPVRDTRLETRTVAADMDAVVQAVRQGHTAPKDIYAVLAHRPSTMLKRAARRAVEQGLLTRTGQTNSTRYHVTAPAAPARPSVRPVVSEGVELETVWNGQKGDPSLLGARDCRGSSLANA